MLCIWPSFTKLKRVHFSFEGSVLVNEIRMLFKSCSGPFLSILTCALYLAILHKVKGSL